MHILLSSSKTQDFTQKSPLPRKTTMPIFAKEVEKIMQELQQWDEHTIMTNMKVSNKLAASVCATHKDFFVTIQKKAALFAYTGTVYKAVDVEKYSAKDLQFAQEHLFILSGLYGLLRPLDVIHPYRLEMKLQHSFWKEKITAYLEKNTDSILNLASKESTLAIDLKRLGKKVYTPVFLEKKGSAYKTVAVYAKKARGMMADWVIQEEITDREKIKQFSLGGYIYAPTSSEEYRWVRTQ